MNTLPPTAEDCWPAVAVVVLNWNGARDTVACLQSLVQLDYPVFGIIVCDNGSTDGSLLEIGSWINARGPGAPSVLVQSTGANLGFAGGNNVGIRLALADPQVQLIWLINNDTVAEPTALRRLVEAMEVLPAAGLCGSTMLDYDDPSRVRAGRGRYRARWGWIGHVSDAETGDRPQPMAPRMLAGDEYPIGASLLMSRALVEQTGLLCEDYFLYFEELDLVHRMRPLFAAAVAPASLVLHREAAATGAEAGGGRALADYCFARARMQFTRRFYPQHRWTVLAASLVSVVRRYLLGRPRNAAAVWAGLRDGWAGRMGAAPTQRWVDH
jgi:GT2 family glycosyltransferase